MVFDCFFIRSSISGDGEQESVVWGFGDVSARKNGTLGWQLQQVSLLYMRSSLFSHFLCFSFKIFCLRCCVPPFSLFMVSFSFLLSFFLFYLVPCPGLTFLVHMQGVNQKAMKAMSTIMRSNFKHQTKQQWISRCCFQNDVYLVMQDWDGFICYPLKHLSCCWLVEEWN